MECQKLRQEKLIRLQIRDLSHLAKYKADASQLCTVWNLYGDKLKPRHTHAHEMNKGNTVLLKRRVPQYNTENNSFSSYHNRSCQVRERVRRAHYRCARAAKQSAAVHIAPSHKDFEVWVSRRSVLKTSHLARSQPEPSFDIQSVFLRRKRR